jgi:hypothetical protein
MDATTAYDLMVKAKADQCEKNRLKAKQNEVPPRPAFNIEYWFQSMAGPTIAAAAAAGNGHVLFYVPYDKRAIVKLHLEQRGFKVWFDSERKNGQLGITVLWA